ncbi:MAG TPA: HD domain-containing phosphohydrolase [Vicinamibacterales bacterium]|nr:HD domain-containing phosphohydrolase [Vicinamibacterales bacterium]
MNGQHAETILVVEDDVQVASLITRLMHHQGFRTEVAVDGESGLVSIAERPPALILLDVGLPGIDGYEVCRRVKENPATRLTPVILLTGRHAPDSRIAGINAGADDFVPKPFRADELQARVRSLIKLKSFTDELESIESIIVSLALTVEAKDSYTEGHCERLAVYATALGAEIGLVDADLASLRRGGYLHDVGKVGIPDRILRKRSRLTRREFEFMKRHTLIGESLCGNLRSLAAVRSIIRHHHERLDGSGYPDGLRGDAIPLLAQIVAVVDVFDAITTRRPYREAMTVARACEELQSEALGRTLNPDLIAPFLKIVERCCWNDTAHPPLTVSTHL